MAAHQNSVSYPSGASQSNHAIDEIITVHKLREDVNAEQRDITKRHWKNADSSKTCNNLTCRKPFTFYAGPAHCWRCGSVFCKSCLQFTRKLNYLAHPDPEGKPYKVCQSCFNEGQLTEGVSRTRTKEFHFIKSKVREQQKMYITIYGSGGWRNRFDLDKECSRLINGFKHSIGRSEVRRSLQDVKSLLTIPDWQKSTFYVVEGTLQACQKCQLKFGLIMKKRQCTVCGKAVCKSCSSEELLIYIPDDDLDEEMCSDPKLAIIKVVGCPEVEPKISIYLLVCVFCKEILTERQLSQEEKARRCNLLSSNGLLSQLSDFSEKFEEISKNVDQQLLEYRKIVESFENAATCQNHSQSKIKTLAKAQGDLSDFFTKHILVLQQLKKLTPNSDTQSKLMQAFIKSKCEYYLENSYIFRQLERKLSKVLPPNTLEYIQRVIDENILEKEAKMAVEKKQENWDKHLSDVQELIRKGIKHHKLIKISCTQKSQRSTQYVLHVLHRRCEEVVCQIQLQLAGKATHRSFQLSKKALAEMLQE